MAPRAGVLTGANEGALGVDLLFHLHQLISGDGAGCFGGLLQARVGSLESGELGIGLQPVGLQSLHLGFGLGDVRRHFRGAQFGEELALLYDAAAIHQDLFDVAGHPRVQGDAQEGQELARQIDASGNGFCDDGNEQIVAARRGERCKEHSASTED